MNYKIYFYTLTIILIFFTFFAYKIVASNALIAYPEQERISLRQESVHQKRPSFFYNPAIRFPTDDGGFGFGK